ncbi:hypothetical protein [Streptomyces sp. N50]|uniref:hypothetical protein n=1 Tax=Streptomyces sp. N50 TaxID=3081765 RepID=UPI002962286F|nr:hypothetical protein [Streptomyces sp. N50]WOX15519.1 hypothetical protein R2B38_44660 [Streptomyces sp. N50]
MGLLDPINALGEIAVDVLVCGRAASPRCPPRKTLRTTGRPPFTVVVDREGDVRFTRTVLAAHHPAAGRVVVHPTVSGGGRLLWHDVLHAVADGRPLRSPVCAASGNASAQERSARAALKAAGVRRLTVLRAHRFGCGVWAELVALHRTTRTDVTVVHHAGLPADLAHLLRHCDHRILTTHADVRALHPPAETSGESWVDVRHR